ncbi:MAG: hypothetical protein E6R03_12370 [Hyphomicrobiaceae bacterium]|nr:MAG: hypothetical protein E6R03_12370 [Hyphomicrobiaceae bacterium]
MSVTPSEWSLLRALAWHSVMCVKRGGAAAARAKLLLERGFLRVGHEPVMGLYVIRITDAGRAEAAKIEKELNNDDPK